MTPTVVKIVFFVIVAAIMALVMLMAGCATQIDRPPPATAIKVSVPCAALNDVEDMPEITPDQTLKVLGQSCKAGDERSCARVVYLIGVDRSKLADWARIAQTAVSHCKK